MRRPTPKPLLRRSRPRPRYHENLSFRTRSAQSRHLPRATGLGPPRAGRLSRVCHPHKKIPQEEWALALHPSRNMLLNMKFRIRMTNWLVWDRHRLSLGRLLLGLSVMRRALRRLHHAHGEKEFLTRRVWRQKHQHWLHAGKRHRNQQTDFHLSRTTQISARTAPSLH